MTLLLRCQDIEGWLRHHQETTELRGLLQVMAAARGEKVDETIQGKPTTQDILNGSWAMKGETLGGLLSGGLPVPSTRDQPTPDVSCVILVAVKAASGWGAAGPDTALRLNRAERRYWIGSSPSRLVRIISRSERSS